MPKLHAVETLMKEVRLWNYIRAVILDLEKRCNKVKA